jgi:hypothetical protein
MAFNTGNAVPSTDARDLSDNAENLDQAVNAQADTWQDRLSVQRDTVAGRIKKMGFTVPIAYAASIVFAIDDNVKTVEEAGVVYAPLPSALPFTTSGTFTGDDDARFFVVQGLLNTSVDVVTEFATRQLMIDSTIVFPTDKPLHVINTNADYIVTAGASPNVGSPALTGFGHAAIQIYNDTVTLRQLGAAEDAVGDGVEAGTTDDTAVVTYAATLGINVIVSNKCMVSASMPNKSKFFGALGAQVSQFVVKPATLVDNLFNSVDESNTSFNKVGFIGNNLASGGGAAGLRFGALTKEVQDNAVTECYFENFKHNYWVYFTNLTSAFKCIRPIANNNVFVSKTGNDIDNTNIGVPATCIAFQGSITVLTGRVEDLQANNNNMKCSHMKRGVDVWGNCHKGQANYNTIANAGLNGFDDTATYAICLYSNRFIAGAPEYAYDPSGIESKGNKITNPRDCGYYLQSINESNIHHNNIQGQTSTADGTIPKGAIAPNGVHATNIHHNYMIDNAIDINSTNINSKPDREIEFTLSYNECLSKVSNNVRITTNTTSSLAGFKSTLNWDSNIVSGDIIIKFSATSENFDLNITDGIVKDSLLNGIFLFEVAPSTPAKPINVIIDGTKIFDIAQDAVSYTKKFANVEVRNCHLDLGTIGRNCVNFAGSKNGSINYNRFWTSKTPLAGDFCINVTGAGYTSVGNTMEGIDAANKQTGFVAPFWLGHEGERVQTLRSSEQGAPTDKYVLQGYANDGTTGTVFSGTHDGAADAAVLTDTGQSWAVDSLIGLTLNNTTDGSTTTITSNTATTATGVLSGGSENDWDVSDAYTIIGSIWLEQRVLTGN